jgi:Flp pilus assembly protein TadG
MNTIRLAALSARVAGIVQGMRPADAAALSRHLRGLIRDQRGVSAVEFAMLLPLMITLYLGAVEISQGIGIDRKVTLTTRTVADLASQVSSINNADMTNLLNASAAVIVPYDTTKLKVTVSEITIDSNGTAKIVWSDTLNGTKRTVGSTVTLPAALNVASTSLIWSEVSYSFKPTIGYVVTGTLNLTDQIYMRPRISDTVSRVP